MSGQVNVPERNRLQAKDNNKDKTKDNKQHDRQPWPEDTRPFARLGARRRTVDALERMGISEPTLIQERAIPPLLTGRDVIGQSRTGSGKTIAFGLPLVERVDPRQRQLQALVLVPTRELAAQVAGVIESLDGGRGLRVAQLIGGRALGPQKAMLTGGAQIAVGAPGRVLDHLRQGNLRLDGLKVCVLDEADQMLDQGFAPDVERILAATPADRQMALFTATLPEWTTQIAQKYLSDPVRVDAGSPEGTATPAIEQIIYLVPEGRRLEALCALLDRRKGAEGNTLVFARTKHGVMRLQRQLHARGYMLGALQGNMSQNARDRAIAEFRSGRMPMLLATNVAARGLDVLSIEQVINYELPESAELFTHRVGRTGRMEREGEAITLVTPSDLPPWKRMQRDLGVNLPARAWPQDEMPLPPADPNTAPTPSQPQQRGAQIERRERPRSDFSQGNFSDERRTPRQPRSFGDSSRGERSPARRRFGGRGDQRPRGDR